MQAARRLSSSRSPTAARERPRSCGSRAAASGGRRTCTTRSAGRAPARWLLLPDGTAVVEAAAAVPLDPERLDPLAASSRGFGELVAAALAEGPSALLLCLGGTATMDAGAGLLEVARRAAGPGARRLRRDGDAAGGAERSSARRRAPARPRSRSSSGGFAAREELVLFNTSPAAALRAVSARRSRRSAPSSFRARRSCSTRPASTASGYDLVVTGEGRVDATTALGKAPGEVVRRSAGTRCVVFGGIVEVRDSRASRRSRSPATRRGRGKTSSSWAET